MGGELKSSLRMCLSYLVIDLEQDHTKIPKLWFQGSFTIRCSRYSVKMKYLGVAIQKISLLETPTSLMLDAYGVAVGRDDRLKSKKNRSNIVAEPKT